jgi:hypothetical protein
MHDAFIYFFAFIAGVWGITTMIALKVEEREIKELIESARKANSKGHYKK